MEVLLPSHGQMTKTIHMGQFDTVRSPDKLKTTLGSCVGVVLYDPDLDVFGMAHIMLPGSEVSSDQAGQLPSAGKYVDTAIPALIALMGTPTNQTHRLKAKLAGGANMFSTLPGHLPNNTLRIGEKNVSATKALLEALGIVVLGEDLGGGHGRELSIDADSGKVWVRTIGQTPREL